jgi:hypothetical protein
MQEKSMFMQEKCNFFYLIRGTFSPIEPQKDKSMKKLIFLLVCVGLFINCNEDDTDDFEDSFGIIFQQINSKFESDGSGGYSLAEFPFVRDGDTLGFIKIVSDGSNEPDSDNVEYLLTNEFPVGAFTVDQNTGYVTVKNAYLLDTRTVDIISFSIQARNKNLNRIMEKKYVLTELSADMVIGINKDEFFSDSYSYNIKSYDFRGLNVRNGKILDNIVTKPLVGKTQYSLSGVIPEGAVAIDQESGVLWVKDEKLFNSQLYKNITFNIDLKVEHKESNRTWITSLGGKVLLSILNSEFCYDGGTNLFLDYSKGLPVLLSNQNGFDFVISPLVEFTMEEYSFIPRSDLYLCTANVIVDPSGAYLNSFKLLNDQGDILVQVDATNFFEDIFGYSHNDFIAAPMSYLLNANKKYTIRRTKKVSDGGNTYLKTVDGSSFDFPVHYEDVTITGAKFYMDDTQLDVKGIPLINLIFVK